MDRCQAERIGELGLRRRQSDRVILDHADRQLAPEQLTQKPAKKLLNDTEDATLSLAIELEGQAYSRLAACTAPMISEKALRPFKPSARQTSAEAEHGGDDLARIMRESWRV